MKYTSKTIDITLDVDIFWNIAPCSPHLKQRIGGTYYLQLKGKKSAQKETRVEYFTSTFLFRLLWCLLMFF
jgi:hypothetical protein